MKVKTQPDNYSCGIYSIINALIVYGENLSRDEIKPLTGTTYRNGTDEKGLQNALTELGYKYKIYSTKNNTKKSKNNAWRWVLNNSSKKPLILYVDGDHWLVVAGRIKNKVVIIDSLENCNIVNKKELLEKWSTDNKLYWGMSISDSKD